MVGTSRHILLLEFSEILNYSTFLGGRSRRLKESPERLPDPKMRQVKTGLPFCVVSKGREGPLTFWEDRGLTHLSGYD